MMEMMILDDHGVYTSTRVSTRSEGLARLAETRDEVARIAKQRGIPADSETYEIGLARHTRECGGRHCPDELGLAPGCSFDSFDLAETT